MDKIKTGTIDKDENEINELVARFFDLFTNTNNQTPNIWDIKNLFLSNGILINNTSGWPEVYDLESFVKPREEILTNGTLVNFEEKETYHETEIHGNIACRISRYEKSGSLNRQPYSGGGIKLMQFVKKENKWFLSSVLWSDET